MSLKVRMSALLRGCVGALAEPGDFSCGRFSQKLQSRRPLQTPGARQGCGCARSAQLWRDCVQDAPLIRPLIPSHSSPESSSGVARLRLKPGPLRTNPLFLLNKSGHPWPRSPAPPFLWFQASLYLGSCLRLAGFGGGPRRSLGFPPRTHTMVRSRPWPTMGGITLAKFIFSRTAARYSLRSWILSFVYWHSAVWDINRITCAPNPLIW